MDLYEHQGKELFRALRHPGLRGTRRDDAGARRAPRPTTLGGQVVVKAQVLTGGRGKAGGIKLARLAGGGGGSARRRSSGIDINGHVVRRLWIEQASDIAKEYYLSITFDRGEKKPLFMLTTQGGVDIEEVAETTPDALARLHVDPLVGFQPYQARRLLFGAGDRRPERAEADARPSSRSSTEAFVDERRDALRDQPADRRRPRARCGARLEVHGRRQRALPASGHRRDARPRGLPGRGARRAREGRHVREARRRGRDPRQRRRARHVHAGRDRAGRRAAGELLRPRRRRRRARASSTRSR